MKIVIKNESSKVKTNDLDLAKLVLDHMKSKQDDHEGNLIKNSVKAGMKLGIAISNLASRSEEKTEEKSAEPIKKLVDDVTRKKARKTPVGKIIRNRWTRSEVDLLVANKDKTAKKISKILPRHSLRSIGNVLHAVRKGNYKKFAKNVRPDLNK